MKDESVLFNLKRENNELKKEIANLQNQCLVRQDIIDKMMNMLFKRAQQLMQVTSILLKAAVPMKGEGGEIDGETEQ